MRMTLFKKGSVADALATSSTLTYKSCSVVTVESVTALMICCSSDKDNFTGGLDRQSADTLQLPCIYSMAYVYALQRTGRCCNVAAVTVGRCSFAPNIFMSGL